jgi:hypothetical protein
MLKSAEYLTVTSLLQACVREERLLQDIIDKVTDQFVVVAREDLEDQELVGVDYANTFHGSEGVCALHDYVDANMTMGEAFDRVAREEVQDPELSPTVTDSVLGEGPEADVARQIWNSSWDAAQKRGYSPLWGRRSELVEEDFEALSAILLARPDHARYDDPRFPHLPLWVDAEDEIHAASAAFLVDLDQITDLKPVAASVKAAVEVEDEQKIVESLSAAVQAPVP